MISTPGITSYELACLGIPTIFIPINKEQKILSNEFQKKGFGMSFEFFGNNFPELERKIIVLNNYKKRLKMFQSGRKIVDGKGVFRIGKIINELLDN